VFCSSHPLLNIHFLKDMVISKRNFGSLNHFGWGFITYYIPSQKFLSEIFLLMNENIHKWGQKTRLRLVLLFANNWSSERIIYGCLSSLTKKLTILKFCTRGIRLIISWIEWNQTHYLKKNQVPTFFIGLFFVFSFWLVNICHAIGC
jgi:hypothetical protein